MALKPKSISELAEYWDKLTPNQQQFMIHKAQWLVAYNNNPIPLRQEHKASLAESNTDIQAETKTRLYPVT